MAYCDASELCAHQSLQRAVVGDLSFVSVYGLSTSPANARDGIYLLASCSAPYCDIRPHDRVKPWNM